MKPLIQAQPPQPPTCPSAYLETRPPTCHTSTVLSIPLLICNACETSHTSTVPSTPLLIWGYTSTAPLPFAKPVPLPVLICNACETFIQAQPPQPPCLSAKPAPLRPPTCHTSTVLSIPLLICNACETSHTSTVWGYTSTAPLPFAKPVPLPVTQAQSPQPPCLSATPVKPFTQAPPPQPPCLSAKPAPLRPPTCHTSTVLSIPWLICNACETSHTSTVPSTPLLICKTCRTAYLRNPAPYLSHKHSPLKSPAYLQRLSNLSHKHSPLNPPAYLQNLSHCLSAKPVSLPVTQAQSSQFPCSSATPVKLLISAKPVAPAKPVPLPVTQAQSSQFPCSSATPVKLLTQAQSPQPSCLSAKPVALLICETRELQRSAPRSLTLEAASFLFFLDWRLFTTSVAQ